MSLLEQDTIKRKQVKKMLKLDAGNENNKNYEGEAIGNSAVYTNKSKLGHLPDFYYLVV